MAKTFKYGAGIWATKTGSSMAYNDQNDNYKPTPFSVTRDSIATRVNKQGLIEVVGQDKLRIDYTDSSNGVALLEPSRTNNFQRSEEFDNTYWVKSRATVTANQVTSPDGNVNADYLEQETGQTNRGSAFRAITYTATSYSLSVFAKKKEKTFINLSEASTGSIKATWFDLNNGVVGTTNASHTAKIEDFGNGWYRCSIVFTANAGSASTLFYLADTDNSTTVTDSGGIYIWGAQLEAGSYATSYISTSGQSGGVTRAADVANGAGNEQVFNDSEGVLFANMAALADDSTNKVITLSDGTTSNRVQVYFNSSNGITGAVAGQASISYSTNIKLNSKVAFKYKTNDFALWVSGFKVGTDVIGSSPNGLKEIDFDNGSGASNYYGKTKELGYYDTALTDAELEALTSYTSFTNMANELNLTIK